jgi:hypothetical protein
MSTGLATVTTFPDRLPVDGTHVNELDDERTDRRHAQALTVSPPPTAT